MPDPQTNPTAPRPDQVPKPAEGQIPESTQENMGDGSGIRGDYGDASQTNGLEGGPDETDTELTGS